MITEQNTRSLSAPSAWRGRLAALGLLLGGVASLDAAAQTPPPPDPAPAAGEPAHIFYGAVPPSPPYERKPLVLVFLQFDVNEMGNLTGGSPGYFQQQIRKAFNKESLTDKLSVEIDGKTVEAVRVRMQPFHDDPNIERFPAFRDKTYEFVVADEVPGGLVRIAASTTDPKTGDIVIEKSMTFERVDP